MVSFKGACAAYYNYGRFREQGERRFTFRTSPVGNAGAAACGLLAFRMSRNGTESVPHRTSGVESMRKTTTLETPDFNQMSCPLPLAEYERVLLGHGSGGTLSAKLIQDVILPGLGCADCDRAALEDQATPAACAAGAQRREDPADRLHDRFFRSPSPIFPWRRHRATGRAWDRQRPGSRRRDAAISFGWR
jgi:hypothetical protein